MWDLKANRRAHPVARAAMSEEQDTLKDESHRLKAIGQTT